MTGIPGWHIAGDWFDNCSCAVACPCTFAQPPDNGFCDSVLFWHIQRGHYGDVNLDGLSFLRVGRWEGDLWAGKVKGTAGLFIDERADECQAGALPLIFGGLAGGFPARIAALFTEGRQVRGVERARITFDIAPDRAHWGAEIAGKVKAWARALTGSTSLPEKYPQLMNAPGCETGPGPQLVTWGKSTICSVDAFGYKFQWTTNSSKHIPFDWTGRDGCPWRDDGRPRHAAGGAPCRARGLMPDVRRRCQRSPWNSPDKAWYHPGRSRRHDNGVALNRARHPGESTRDPHTHL